MNREQRRKALRAILEERILVLDGAMGTSVQKLDLDAKDFGGADFEGCNENLVRTRSDVVREIHESFLTAGADVIETDTFGATGVVLAEYGLQDRTPEINRRAAEVARAAADAATTLKWPRFVAGSMGPTTKSMSVTGGVTWDELAEAYREQAEGLIQGGVDVLLLETVLDTLNVKAGLDGIDRACAALGASVPVAVSVTIDTMGTLLAGQDIEALYVSLAHRDLLWIGLNCATGPDFMTDHLRTLAAISRFPVACVPNAGLPDEDGKYNETPWMVADKLAEFADRGWVNLVGGCCGTVPDHIRRLADAVRDKPPRRAAATRRWVVSGIETLLVDEDTRPVIVGERTNVLGSRAFKRLVAAGKLEEAAEVGRRQVRRGAHVVDVCLQDPDRDERADVLAFLDHLVKKVKVPLMIDSTDPAVIEAALRRSQGKAVINSINLEDGEERFRAVVPLARRYGAALVVGCIDDNKEQAQAISRDRKLEIARRSHRLLTGEYGVPEEDIVFDPLVFPVGTGDRNYIGAGVETIEGLRLIKEAFPACRTLLGVSNVSFGLPPAGREVLNAVFLYHCVQTGLDMAIVNAEKLRRYGSITEEERRLAEDLIWWRGEDPIAAFNGYFGSRKPQTTAAERGKLSVDERLSLAIIEGSREGLSEDLDEALRGGPALDVVNGPLMAGMAEVGRRFGANELIVAEVLQSAEVMKAAVAHLEPHMQQGEAASKGKILLATVKGDVHDIGKNLVEIILRNNGYEVVNLGIKVTPERLVQACREHEPDMIGLSGLLVKSARQMATTAQDLRAAGVNCPILVGGAALSNRFTRLKIAPEYEGMVLYAADAMAGLDLANRLGDARQRRELQDRLAGETEKLAAVGQSGAAARAPSGGANRVARLSREHDIPKPPDLKLHCLDYFDLDEVFRYVNPVMLYARHLGFKGKFSDALARGDSKAVEIEREVQWVKEVMLREPTIGARAVYKFFPAQSDGDEVLILAPGGTRVLEQFHFLRQAAREGLCLADYVLPRAAGRLDYVAMFVTTVGPGVRVLAERWKESGEYLRSHILQALALESAEGFAELLHAKIRRMWGFPDPEGTALHDLFKCRYRGVRVSFGYPACPRLEDQEQLFRLLEVEERIGVALTDGYMMDPEGSVSAVVFHHSQAKYFSVAAGGAERREVESPPSEDRAPA